MYNAAVTLGHSTRAGIMGKIGRGPQDAGELADHFQHVDGLRTSLKDLSKRLHRDAKAGQQGAEEAGQLAEAVAQLAGAVQDDVLGGLAGRVVGFLQMTEDLRAGLAQLQGQQLAAGLAAFVDADLREARESRKHFDKVRAAYDSALAQLHSQKARQKVNLNKVLEAEVKKETCEEVFVSTAAQTQELLAAVAEKAGFVALEHLCILMESYHSFFASGFEFLKDMKPFLLQYRQAAAQRRAAFEAGEGARMAKRQQERIRLERKKRLAKTARAVFGLPLADVLERDGAPCPWQILATVDYLHLYGLQTEGVFRISASKLQLEECIASIDQGAPVQWAPDRDVHVAAGVLKNYLRELPDPLMTAALFDQWTALNDVAEEEFEAGAAALFAALPRANRYLLSLLLKLCHSVAEWQEVNKMGPKQLAIVLAPNVLYLPADALDPGQMVTRMASANQVLFKLIASFAGFTWLHEALFELEEERAAALQCRQAEADARAACPNTRASVAVAQELSASKERLLTQIRQRNASHPSLEAAPPSPPAERPVRLSVRTVPLHQLLVVHTSEETVVDAPAPTWGAVLPSAKKFALERKPVAELAPPAALTPTTPPQPPPHQPGHATALAAGHATALAAGHAAAGLAGEEADLEAGHGPACVGEAASACDAADGPRAAAEEAARNAEERRLSSEAGAGAHAGGRVALLGQQQAGSRASTGSVQLDSGGRAAGLGGSGSWKFGRVRGRKPS